VILSYLVLEIFLNSCTLRGEHIVTQEPSRQAERLSKYLQVCLKAKYVKLIHQIVEMFRVLSTSWCIGTCHAIIHSVSVT
jgi:hypothetical protein